MSEAVPCARRERWEKAADVSNRHPESQAQERAGAQCARDWRMSRSYSRDSPAQHGVAPLGKVPLVDHRHEVHSAWSTLSKDHLWRNECASFLLCQTPLCSRCKADVPSGLVCHSTSKRPNVQAASVLLLAQVGNVNVVPPQGAPASHMCVISKTGSQGSSRVCEYGQRIHCPGGPTTVWKASQS